LQKINSIIKIMKKHFENYETPEVEYLEIEVEKGFATTGGGAEGGGEFPEPDTDGMGE
jgi:hypothetical protein